MNYIQYMHTHVFEVCSPSDAKNAPPQARKLARIVLPKWVRKSRSEAPLPNLKFAQKAKPKMVTEKWPKMDTEMSLKNTPQKPQIWQKREAKNGYGKLGPRGSGMANS